MGKFKRSKSRPKREERFVNTKMVLKLLHENLDLLESLTPKIQIEKHDIDYGDEWYNEHGYEYLLMFEDKSAYLVGHVYITEDSPDWAQAECYGTHMCNDYYGDRNVKPLEIIEKLELLINSN